MTIDTSSEANYVQALTTWSNGAISWNSSANTSKILYYSFDETKQMQSEYSVNEFSVNQQEAASSAVKLDLSPEAQRIIESQNNPEFEPQTARTMLEAFSASSGINVNWGNPLTQQVNREEKLSTATEISRYLFAHPEEAMGMKTMLDSACMQADQAVRGKHSKDEFERLNMLHQNLSTMSSLINRALQEKGLQPKAISAQPDYLQSAVPELASQQRDYDRYMERRLQESHISMTPELKTLMQPELIAYMDVFGHAKFRLEDKGVENTAMSLIGLTQSINNIQPEAQRIMQASSSDPHNDVSVYQQKANEDYASKMKELKDGIISASQMFAREGRLEQAQAALNPHLEPLGLRMG